jgi:acetyl esterase/lipase
MKSFRPLRLFAAWLALNVILPAIPARAAEPTEATEEKTPLTLPGAEAFAYRTGASETMRLFVVKPKGWTAEDRRPAMMFFFGGGWTKGTPERSVSWAKFAASLGIVGIAPDYRTKGRFGTSPLESVADGRAALHWVQEHAKELGLDPAKIVVGGSSSGGHVALWTAIAHTPPGSDPAEAPLLKPCALVLLSAVADTSPETGYTPKRFGAHTTALSPVHQLDGHMPPSLVFHGDADRTVPYAQAQALHARLIATGNACEFVTVPGGDHGFSTQLPEWKDKTRVIVRAFLDRLKLAGAPGK